LGSNRRKRQSETKEWLESLSAVLNSDGKERAQYIIRQLIEHSYREGSGLVMSRNTPYINTIPPEEEKKLPGDQNIERKIRSLIRWNAAAMVVRANKKNPELGGHIGTFASAATLYDVGMNHFWRAKNNKFGGDLIYFQGHSAPGIYARSYLEGRFSVNAMESTTDEIIAEYKGLEENKALSKKLKEILQQCDLAKFAKFKPTEDENKRIMKSALDFVSHTKPKPIAEENDNLNEKNTSKNG